MADLQGVIGLLRRADWTRLSMSAEVHFESDRDLALSRLPAWEHVPGEERGGYHSGRVTLLIAPGGRYRQESGDELPRQVRGSDGERGWIWSRPDLAPPSSLLISVGDEPPFPELFCPSGLLSGFTLEVRGPVTACGRDAISVAATPRTSIGHVPRLRGNSFDRLEAIVDADFGILLRREETIQGQRLSLTELTAVVLSPPEAADRTRFTPPAVSATSLTR